MSLAVENHRAALWRVSIVQVFCFFFSVLAVADSFHGIPSKMHKVITEDGVTLVVYEIGYPHAKAIVDLRVGTYQTIHAADERIIAYVNDGYKVVGGHIRLAGRGESL